MMRITFSFHSLHVKSKRGEGINIYFQFSTITFLSFNNSLPHIFPLIPLNISKAILQVLMSLESLSSSFIPTPGRPSEISRPAMQPSYVLLPILLHISFIADIATALSPRINLIENTPVALAPGIMVNTLDPDYLPVEDSTRSRMMSYRRRTHVKDIMATLAPRQNKPVCPPEKPWLCEGKTCLNKFFQVCCKGGGVCDNPQHCVSTMFNTITCG
ncbi:hypothetical protein I7I53_01780 [Histoplasma capsulatum var. duboisii H88]|uniref:Uncharacterized protein n=1 Tax=Ajellomyces capsulatus (strain H88) TaxID=544711 RepID=A0A8A1LIS8_AJEC8|nr:hypothetical protein I7I53_01780 [Histoplasma capsulatum var. duboisii H88]